MDCDRRLSKEKSERPTNKHFVDDLSFLLHEEEEKCVGPARVSQSVRERERPPADTKKEHTSSYGLPAPEYPRCDQPVADHRAPRETRTVYKRKQERELQCLLNVAETPRAAGRTHRHTVGARVTRSSPTHKHSGLRVPEP